MSKIEEYHAKLTTAKAVRFDCTFTEVAKERWTPAMLRFFASHGYYGSSSSYSDMSEQVGRFVAQADSPQNDKHRIGPSRLLARRRKAAELAETEAETACLAAADEAAQVLAEVRP